MHSMHLRLICNIYLCVDKSILYLLWWKTFLISLIPNNPLYLFWRFVYFGFPSAKSTKVHAIRDFTKKLSLIESFLGSQHSHSRTNVMQKASVGAEAHSKFWQTSKDGTSKTGCGWYFCKLLNLRSSAEFWICLNLWKLVLSFEYTWIHLGSQYKWICLNMTGFWICLNKPE